MSQLGKHIVASLPLINHGSRGFEVRSCFPTMPLALRRIPNPPGTRPCCSMPYYPCPDVDTELHSDSSETNFYVVERGFVVGTYTDP